ncbi:1-acyl-sn-glycerol-3-phosphate acyltransferase [Mariniblastus fucicola]|uniref:Acyltransferase n=1 Tax=Mariniblastus fucicola TaxID=980251 RepID=A0A5B9P6S2_9BACT|nr:1-acyl-sn-glycerol-3-phosphate acyltransferase [Mariniblastus fucicola]QEG21239.1 Acyltransferase [Mariniblastus fucicola]
MQKIFIEKPYRFVRPLMSTWLPWLLNNRLIHSTMLRTTESIVAVKSRGVDRLEKSIKAGHGVVMIGNHPRVSDPVVIYDLIRQANSTMFAMASWHLFNQGWLNTAIIRTFGGYSVNREGLDRESINFSVSMLQKNERPILMFPEGATSRTNGSLMPFLDGPTFVARTASRRRHRQGLKTVIHPIVIRYEFVGDFATEFEKVITSIENELQISPSLDSNPAKRVQVSLDALVAKQERAFDRTGNPNHSPFQRRQHLADSVMEEAEVRWFGTRSEKNIANRIRDIRSRVFPELLENENLSAEERNLRWHDLERTYLAWQMASYPQDYLAGDASKDRILEISAKILEDLTDRPRKCGKQKVTIEVCEAIEVPPTKHPSGKPDPLIAKIQHQLENGLFGSRED